MDGTYPKQFAQSIGRSEAVIQTYEQGTRNYTFETLLEIAQTPPYPHHNREDEEIRKAAMSAHGGFGMYCAGVTARPL